MEPRKSIAKNSLYSVIYNLVNVILPLVSSIYVSRVLLPAGVGKVAYANAFVSYFVTFATLGMPTYGVSTIGKNASNTKEKNTAFSELVIINAISTSVAIIVYLIMIFSIESLRKDSLLYLCCGIQLFLCYFNIDWLYKGEEEYGYIAKRNFIIKVLSLACLFLFVKGKDDYLIYALITSIALGANYFFNVLKAKKHVKLCFHNLRLGKHLKPLLFLGISLFFSSIYSRIDVTMLGIMVSETSVGIYSNGHKIINIVITACNSITAVFLPRMSYLFTKNKEEFLRLLNYGLRIIAFISIPACFGLMFLAPDLVLLLYGESFRAAGIVLRIFSLLIIVKSFGDLICYQTVISIGKEKSLVPAAGAAMIVNVVLNLALIPSYHEVGATIASVAGEFLVNFLMLLYVKSRVSFRINGREIGKIITATGFMCITLAVIKKIGMSHLWTCVVGMFTGGCVYFLVSLLLKNEFLMNIMDSLRKKYRK